MHAEEKKHNGNSIFRLAFVGLSLLLQIGWILLQVLALNEHSAWISLFSGILALLIVLRLYSRHTTSAMKMPWIMLILAFPVMGLSLYLMMEVFADPGSTGKRLRAVRAELQSRLPRQEGAFAALEARDRRAANQSRYLRQYTGAPVYANTDAVYFADAADALEAMKADLEKAERFIFMEYFIVREGSAFSELREILERKAGEGDRKSVV